jgi:hypothetical protein
MNKVKNLSRYWIDEGSGIIVRTWTNEEYKNINPHTHIFEKYWSYCCPICNFIPIPHSNKEEAEHHANSHRRYTGHKCVVDCRNYELATMEYREEYLEELDVWVAKQEVY